MKNKIMIVIAAILMTGLTGVGAKADPGPDPLDPSYVRQSSLASLANSLYVWGEMYYFGWTDSGVPDHPRGLKYLEAAAHGGHYAAPCYLAQLYGGMGQQYQGTAAYWHARGNCP